MRTGSPSVLGLAQLSLATGFAAISLALAASLAREGSAAWLVSGLLAVGIFLAVLAVMIWRQRKANGLPAFVALAIITSNVVGLLAESTNPWLVVIPAGVLLWSVMELLARRD